MIGEKYDSIREWKVLIKLKRLQLTLAFLLFSLSHPFFAAWLGSSLKNDSRKECNSFILIEKGGLTLSRFIAARRQQQRLFC